MADQRIAPWLTAARGYLGTREIPGARTAPIIERWLIRLRAWWQDDETPWCGVACAAFMQEGGIGILPTHWYRAKNWLNWGEELAGPALGAVVVFGREGGGHVAIVSGRSTDGRLMCIGGNQGNAVSEAPFDWSRVLGYRWPAPAPFAPLVGVSYLPVTGPAGTSSRSEA